jgi:dGTPase
MEWESLHSSLRWGAEHKPQGDAQFEEDQIIRSGYQRDYDRLILSSPFRRLQSKTQVFPMPGSTGSIFVHNRLTHSLEVASVGRSLGSIIGQKILIEARKSGQALSPASERFYQVELPAVIASSCLAHDIGNPPFGHSGEKAIARYFLQGQGRGYQSQLTPAQWLDLTHFEGNAQAFRLLTHHFQGRSRGGYSLTYTTLAAMLKYPCGSEAMEPKGGKVSRKKFGYFQSEQAAFLKIAALFGLPRQVPGAYARHPFVFLVEAADDISYRVIDWEDASRLGIFSTREALQLLMDFFKEERHKAELGSIERGLGYIGDSGEQIAFLRAKTINLLVNECIEIFWQNRYQILEGQYEKSLIDDIPGPIQEALKELNQISIEKIYNYRSVVEIELAGYTVLGGLLEEFVPAILSQSPSHYDKKLLGLLPEQFHPTQSDAFARIQSITDFISGMTDLFAVELFRKIRGIALPGLR